MAIHRRASGSWTGDLKTGRGLVSTQSGALKDLPFSFGTRFGDTPGTNPEELIAAAHAGCYSMAFSAYLGGQGITPNRIDTKALCVLEPVETGGFRIAKMKLTVSGDVPGVDAQRFEQLAREAEKNCPVSNALRGSVEIELETSAG
ncbi:MAG TPA: OsmC family protein [Candidatus Baltobacteraceae bacterium]|nr:OsmC family protein [Candidatus Baltobacteraceae bacterium]